MEMGLKWVRRALQLGGGVVLGRRVGLTTPPATWATRGARQSVNCSNHFGRGVPWDWSVNRILGMVASH